MSDGTFLAYCALLVVSGIGLCVLAIGGFGLGAGARVLNALFAIGFLYYGGYLLFFFEGGEFRIFYYPFVVPVLAIVHVVKSRSAGRDQLAGSQAAYEHFIATQSAPQPAAQPQFPTYPTYPTQAYGSDTASGQPGPAPHPAPYGR